MELAFKIVLCVYCFVGGWRFMTYLRNYLRIKKRQRDDR